MKKIIIAGAGFSGIQVALRLKRKLKYHAEIIVVNDKSGFEFKPWQSNVFNEKKPSVDLASFLQRKGMKFVKDSVKAILPEKKSIKLSKSSIKYDFLVIALGSVPDFSVRGSRENTFKHGEKTGKLSSHLAHILKESNKKEAEKARSVVICGGGVSGVEIAGQVNEFLEKRCFDFGVRRIDMRLFMLESLPELTSLLEPKARFFILDYLTRQGIDIRTKTHIAEVKNDAVVTNNGILHAKTILWACGKKANPVVNSTGLKTDNDGLILNSYMQTSEATIYSLGSCTSGLKYRRYDSCTLGNKARQSKIVAHNISTNIVEGKKKEFKPKNTLVAFGIGNKTAIAVKGSLVFKGIAARIIKKISESYHYFTLK